MARLSFLVDEDTDPLLAAVLRMRGLDAVAVQEIGLRAAKDEELLTRAARDGRVLMTHNVTDFVALAGEWSRGARHHAGILVGRQVAFKTLLRRVSAFVARTSAEEMIDRLEWLENYK